MNLPDTKDAYLKWNQESHENMLSLLNENQQQAIKLIPLILQTNNRILPAYNGPDTPAGIYAYKAGKNILNTAVEFNSKFSYEQETVLSRCIIQSVFLQKNIIDGCFILWVVYDGVVKTKQLNELTEKLSRINRWLKSRGLDVSSYLSSKEDLIKKIKRHKKLFHTSEYLLKSFYAESVLLAGKYPVWWLVPADKEAEYVAFIENIKQKKLINEDDFIDLGCELKSNSDDFIKQMMTHMKMISQSVEKSFMEALFLLAIKSKPHSEVYPASIIKDKLQNQSNEDDISVFYIVVDIIDRYINDAAKGDEQVWRKIFYYISIKYNKLNKLLLKKLSGFDFDERFDDVFVKVNIYKRINQKLKFIFDQSLYLCEIENELVQRQANNMFILLSEHNNKIQIYNKSSQYNSAFDRVLLRQEDNELWSLVIQGDEGDEKVLLGFESLLSLLSWLWLNQLVSRSTQVSIDCISREILQTEAYHLLGVLIQKLDPVRIFRVSPLVYENEARVMMILVFVNTRKNTCEQILVNSWGDVYCSEYSLNSQVLDCICAWTNYLPERGRISSPRFHAFGYAAGESNNAANKIEQIFDGIFTYYFDQKNTLGHYIVNYNEQYFKLQRQGNTVKADNIGAQNDLLKLIEKPNEKFDTYVFERQVMPDLPFRDIFQRNKKNVVQVFFRINGLYCDTWVLDERGSAWQCKQLCIDRDAYLSQWVYLFHNLFRHLKEITASNEESPSVEIQQIALDQLGSWSFYPVSTQALTMDLAFYNVNLKIESFNGQEQMSIVCDDVAFDFSDHGGQVLDQCIAYILNSSHLSMNKPIYITDINVPLHLFGIDRVESLQSLHFLKYKRFFERKLNHLIQIS